MHWIIRPNVSVFACCVSERLLHSSILQSSHLRHMSDLRCHSAKTHKFTAVFHNHGICYKSTEITASVTRWFSAGPFSNCLSAYCLVGLLMLTICAKRVGLIVLAYARLSKLFGDYCKENKTDLFWLVLPVFSRDALKYIECYWFVHIVLAIRFKWFLITSDETGWRILSRHTMIHDHVWRRRLPPWQCICTA